MSGQHPGGSTGPEPAVSRTLGDGRYEVAHLLGRGGMAEVYLAQDVRLGRQVAIKRLRVDLAGDPTFQARFRREAQSAASLNHPSIVAVFDTGEELDPSGSGVLLPYIVMELVEGRTLRDILRDGRKILPQRALEITASVLSALDYSHRAGIIHRDIKPANVMLTKTGEVKVMDFGIARAIADASATMTQTAAVVGTAQYLSPEQARGEQVDARSDLYSAGCLLYELLTRRPPFVGDSPVSVAYQHVREAPSPPSLYDHEVSPAVDAITLKALAKRVDDRYQSASEMRADIERAIDGAPVLAPAVTGAATQETQAHFLARPAPGETSTTMVTPRNGSLTYSNEPPERRRVGLWIFIGVLVVLVLLAAGLLVPRLVGTGSTTTQVDVPRLLGMTLPQARQSLSHNGLTLGTHRNQISQNVPAGQVISQSPNPQQRVDEGSAVNVVVSAGNGKKAVPDVTPFFLQKATELVQGAGFNVQPIKVKTSTLKFGHVIRTIPGPGVQATVGTTVRIFYSGGYINVPNVIGKTQAVATSILTHAGFHPVPLVEPSDQPTGTVTRTDPAPLTPEPFGWTVVIYVSSGPTTPTTPTTPTSPTTPTTPTSPPTSSPPTTTGDKPNGRQVRE